MTSSAFGPNARASPLIQNYTHNLISKPHSIPTSLVVQDQFNSLNIVGFTHTSMDVETFRYY